MSRLWPWIRRVPPPVLSQAPAVPPPSMAASMTKSASSGARLRLLRTLMVRNALPSESVEPAPPMIPAACGLPLKELTLMSPPIVSVPPLPRRMRPWEAMVEAEL